MLKHKLAAAALAATAALAAVPAAHAADEYYLKIDEIPGTVKVGKTAGAIPIESFGLGVEHPSALGSSSSGAVTAKAKFLNITVTKMVDATSPLFFERVATGEHFESMEIIAVKTDPKQPAGTTYMRWIFNPVFVTEQGHNGETGDDAAEETLTFQAGVMKQHYSSTGADGKALNVITVWNQVTNSPSPLVPKELGG